MAYDKVMNCNIFKNQNPTGTQPHFGNSKVTIDVSIEPGTYSVGVWQYEDSGNLSFSLTKQNGNTVANNDTDIDGDIPNGFE